MERCHYCGSCNDTVLKVTEYYYCFDCVPTRPPTPHDMENENYFDEALGDICDEEFDFGNDNEPG